MSEPWPHAPVHIVLNEGIFMVTAATYKKLHIFNTEDKLQMLHDKLLACCKYFDWELHAWAVFSNHYHFIARSSKNPEILKKMIPMLHKKTASEVNRIDSAINRKVWHQYWDTRINRHTSYLARLKYVHHNPVKHGLVENAVNYPWCSAAEFERKAKKSFVKSVYNFKIDTINIYDNY